MPVSRSAVFFLTRPTEFTRPPMAVPRGRWPATFPPVRPIRPSAALPSLWRLAPRHLVCCPHRPRAGRRAWPLCTKHAVRDGDDPGRQIELDQPTRKFTMPRVIWALTPAPITIPAFFGDYDTAMAVDPTNPLVVYAAGTAGDSIQTNDGRDGLDISHVHDGFTSNGVPGIAFQATMILHIVFRCIGPLLDRQR